MANLFGDISQSADVLELVPPQLISTTTTTAGVDASGIASNEFVALLSVYNVTAFTSLGVVLQESSDNATGWTNIPSLNSETFPSVVNGTTGPQLIPVQLSNPSSTSQLPYRYVRAVLTLVGTSCDVYLALIGQKKYDGVAAYQNEPQGV